MANRLLEAEVINPKAGQVRANALAARIRNPELRAWFRNAVTYFHTNMEKLDAPYEPARVKHAPLKKGVHATSHFTDFKPFGEVPAEHPSGEIGAQREPTQLRPMLGSWEKHPGEANITDVGYALDLEPVDPNQPQGPKRHRIVIDPNTQQATHGHPKTVYAKPGRPTPAFMSAADWLRWSKEHKPGESVTESLVAYLLEAEGPYSTELHRPHWRAARAHTTTLKDALAELRDPESRTLEFSMEERPGGLVFVATKTPEFLTSAKGRQALADAGFAVAKKKPAETRTTDPGTKTVKPVKKGVLLHRHQQDGEQADQTSLDQLNEVLKGLPDPNARTLTYFIGERPGGTTYVATETPEFLTSREAREILASAGYVVADEERVAPVAPVQGQHAGGWQPAPEIKTGPKGVLLRRIEPEFKPYSAADAPSPDDARYGGPMPAEGPAEVAAPNWAKHTSTAWQAFTNRWDERTFWQKMEMLATYFNALPQMAAEKIADSPADDTPEHHRFRQARATLKLIHNDKRVEKGFWKDANLFLNLLAEAEAYTALIPEISATFKSQAETRLLNVIGNLRLTATDSIAAIMRIASAPSKWVDASVDGGMLGSGSTTRWCVKHEGQAKYYYGKGGTYYIVTKDGDNYALINFGADPARNEGKYAKNANDKDISPDLAAEIAPLFVPFNHDISTPGYGGFATLTAAIQAATDARKAKRTPKA